MKKCTQCKQDLDLENFYAQIQRGKNGQAWPYHDSMCKKCRISYSVQRKKTTKAQAVAYKGGKCIDCGLVDNPCVYDFHHRDPTIKEFSLAQSSKLFNSKVVKEELDKCDLLCANCHRKRHAEIEAFKEYQAG